MSAPRCVRDGLRAVRHAVRAETVRTISGVNPPIQREQNPRRLRTCYRLRVIKERVRRNTDGLARTILKRDGLVKWFDTPETQRNPEVSGFGA